MPTVQAEDIGSFMFGLYEVETTKHAQTIVKYESILLYNNKLNAYNLHYFRQSAEVQRNWLELPIFE